MSFVAGEVVEVFSASAGHKKYHISLGQNEYAVTLCIFLNSDDRFEGNVAFPDSDFPMLPKSKTGKTVVSLANLPRYDDRQLAMFKAVKLGDLPKPVAAVILDAVKRSVTLTRPERDFAVAALSAYINA